MNLELKISKLLRVGVMVVAALLSVGTVLMWTSNHDMLANFSHYAPEPLIEKIHWALLLNDRGTLISIAGLSILVSLPILRVFLTGILFLKQKEYQLSLIAMLVFVSLLLSFLLGFGE